MKICPICKIPKELTEFGHYFSKERNKFRPQNYCKACEKEQKNIRSKEYYSRKSEERKAYMRGYRANPKFKKRRKKLEQHFKKKYRDELQDCYVADQLAQKLKITVKEVRETPGLIQAYRAKIIVIRKIREIKRKHEKQTDRPIKSSLRTA